MAERCCQDCGAPVHANAKLAYCTACRRAHCRICGVPITPGYRTKSCTACERERKAEKHAVPRPCCCGNTIPAGRQSSYCAECLHANYVARRRRLLAEPGRTCRKCGQALPVGYSRTHCGRCQKRSRGRACVRCGAPARRHASYCRACSTMIQAWEIAYKKGDPVARSVKKKRTYQRWQKKEKPHE